jgi:[lysine-biosynthesis-protein LysW]--L-2-aminoadipate ligase
VNVGLLYTTIRESEKLLLSELRERGHEVHKVDVKRETFGVGDPPTELADADLVLDRCLATSQSRYAGRFAASAGHQVVNDPETAATCSDKVRTSIALAESGVPTPETAVAFSEESALEAVERLGYPCVIKPVIGSWGRLMAKIDTRAAAEAVIEHKATLGHYEHKVAYVQEFVDKPGRDLRVLATDGEPVAAMARSSEHWLTNAARGAETESIEVTPEMADLVGRASDAVGSGLLGVDLMEVGDGDGDPDGYTVHEVNHTVEFEALGETTEVDVAARVVDWLETRADEAGGSTDQGVLA